MWIGDPLAAAETKGASSGVRGWVLWAPHQVRGVGEGVRGVGEGVWDIGGRVRGIEERMRRRDSRGERGNEGNGGENPV